jgi:hypothetical protein
MQHSSVHLCRLCVVVSYFFQPTAK